MTISPEYQSMVAKIKSLDGLAAEQFEVPATKLEVELKEKINNLGRLNLNKEELKNLKGLLAGKANAIEHNPNLAVNPDFHIKQLKKLVEKIERFMILGVGSSSITSLDEEEEKVVWSEGRRNSSAGTTQNNSIEPYR